IPPSMMMSSWMGSDFTNDDLVKESSMIDDYTYKLIELDDLEDGLLCAELIPKEDKPIVWGKILLAVREDDYIPVWEKYFDEKGSLKRILNFTDVKNFDSKKIPSVLEMLPLAKEGNKTIIRYVDITFDAVPDNDVFTLRNLRGQ
ncbi:MAG: outer membrane lipoprotein-sorting protein, partial [bacterium]